MAPRVEVPMEFGLELLGSPSHGNLTLELAPGLDPVMVNTAIMSYNSPVIYRHTTELHQNTVDVVEFSREAVLCFSQACYSGQLDELEISIFRHLYKIAVVFKVAWLETRCVKLYADYVENTVQKEFKYEDFLVFYKDAEYAYIHLQKQGLMEAVTAELSMHADKKYRFIGEYIADIDALSAKEVDIICKIAENNKELLVVSIIRCLEKDNSAISPNCNQILKKVDLVNCLKGDPELLKGLQLSIESTDNVSKRDVSTIMKMLQQVYETLVPYKASSLSVAPSNIFHCFREISDFRDVQELIEYIVYHSKDPNLMILLDGLYSWNLEKNPLIFKTSNFDSIIKKIENIKREFGWDEVPWSYFEKMSFSSAKPWFNRLIESDLFINSLTTTEGYLTFFSSTITPGNIFSYRGVSSIVLKTESKIAGCVESGRCGITR